MFRTATSSTPILLGLAATLGLVVSFASSCGGLGSSCQFDSDCTGGNLCIQQTCYAACTAAEDCADPHYATCKAYSRQSTSGDETVKICVGEDFDAGNNDTGGDCEETGDCCTTDAECVDVMGDDKAVCGADNRCIIPVPQPRHAVLIRDRTAVDTSQDPADGGRGADIAAVFVRPADSRDATGFGTAIDYSPVNEASGPHDALDGSAPTLDATGRCVAQSFEETALPLGGDGGYLLVGFENADGQPLRLNNGLELVVIEWGANCGAAGDADTYDVFFCTSESENTPVDPDADCTRQLNAEPSSGYEVLSLSSG